jgi:hypothetical protein
MTFFSARPILRATLEDDVVNNEILLCNLARVQVSAEIKLS